MDLSSVFSLVFQYQAWFELTFRPYLDVIYFFSSSVFNVAFWLVFFLTVGYLALLIFTVLFKRETKEKEFIPKKAPFVSVHIPTRNELIALRCAKKCLEFDYPKEKYEIMLGDDSNIASVSKKLAEFAKRHPLVKVVRREQNIGFKPGNLNNMLDHSKGEIIVVFDSDFVPGKDFLKRIVTPFIHDKEVSAVQAKWNFNNFNQNFITVLASTMVLAFHDVPLSFLSMFGTASLCGSAEAVKKKDLIALGKWRSGSLCEDIEYTLRLQKANKKMVYLPKLECYSEVPFTFADFCKQQMRWAYGVVNSYLVHSMDLLSSRKLSPRKKLLSFIIGAGYLIPIFLVVMILIGLVSIFSHPPEPFDLLKLLFQFSLTTALTSWVVVANSLVLALEKKTNFIPMMVFSFFAFGTVLIYFVNRGIWAAVLKKPMPWYLLNKKSAVKN